MIDVIAVVVIIILCLLLAPPFLFLIGAGLYRLVMWWEFVLRKMGSIFDD